MKPVEPGVMLVEVNVAVVGTVTTIVAGMFEEEVIEADDEELEEPVVTVIRVVMTELTISVDEYETEDDVELEDNDIELDEDDELDDDELGSTVTKIVVVAVEPGAVLVIYYNNTN